MSTIVLGKSSDMWASCLSRPLIRGKTNKQNRPRHHKSRLVAQRMFETATTWSPQTACQRSVLQLIDILSNRLWQTNTRKTTTGKTLDWVGWLYVHVSWVCKARLACDCVTAAVVVVVCHGVHLFSLLSDGLCYHELTLWSFTITRGNFLLLVLLSTLIAQR